MNPLKRFLISSPGSPLVWWRWLPLRSRRWIKRQVKALLWAIVLLPLLILFVYFLDWKDIPWNIALGLDAFTSTTFFSDCHRWLHGFMQEWGNLIIFLIGLGIGLLLPSRTEKQTDQILQFIRGNLLDFESVYTQVCELLEDLEQDEASTFVMVTQSPLLGADLYPVHDNRFYQLIMSRITRPNRIVCLSPYSDQSLVIDPNNSPLRKFYDDLASYNPTTRRSLNIQHMTDRLAASMFTEAAELILTMSEQLHTDVIFAQPIPYQVFLGRKSNGERKCILLLNGWDAIKRNLPSGGFVSEESTFLQLIEESIQILLGVDRNVYEMRHVHTKRILQQCYDYAGDLGSPSTPDEVNVEDKKLKHLQLRGMEFVLFPYVFDPDISESGGIMAETTLRVLKELRKEGKATSEDPLIVWDIGCGCGTLSILAVRELKDAVKVKAIDINPFGTTCATYNAEAHSVEGRIDVFLNESTAPENVFQPCQNEKADLILADLPFLNCHPYGRDLPSIWLQMAYLDSEQRLNMYVLEHAHDYLNEGGKLIISFSDLDSVSEFQEHIDSYNWDIEEQSKEHRRKNGHKWYAFVLMPK